MLTDKRRAFILLGGTVFLQNSDDLRSSTRWTHEDYNITGNVAEMLSRGYMTDTAVHFYTGGIAYNPDPSITLDTIKGVAVGWRAAYNKDSAQLPDVYNGAFPIYDIPAIQWPPVLKWSWAEHCWKRA